jgi:ABC-2 type transport system ATP-binding protein
VSGSQLDGLSPIPALTPPHVNEKPTVTFREVAKRFVKREVFRNVNFSFTGPAVVGVIGNNGAGKTTLLRLAAGILQPTRGTIHVSGLIPSQSRELSALRIGALIEKPGHYDDESVFDNLRFFYRFYFPRDYSEVDGAVRDAIRKCGLDSVKDERVSDLSLGFRQRLALSRAFHPFADVILLDEPFDSLDPSARSDFRGIVREYKERQSLVVFSSHNLAEIETLCDEIIFVDNGRARIIGNFDTIRRRVKANTFEDLDEIYLRIAAAFENE